MNLYSKIEPTLLMHIINRARDIQQGRVDLVPPDEYIQCAAIRMDQGKTFKPHKHKITFKETTITQESWVVIRGMVQVTLYDIDDTVIHTDVLEPGDCSITLIGGHNYLAMHDNTIVYEYKTGPYTGQNNDKVMICLK